MPNVKSQKFVFMGSPAFAATVLGGLLEAGWTPTLVITEPPKPVGRKQVLTPTAVQEFAESHGLPVAKPLNREELLRTLQSVQTLNLAVVAAYGRILTQEMLDLPMYGCVNVHASLLPKYRGASPIQAALLAGDTESGITFMKTEAGLDTGPELAQFPVAVTPQETIASLTEKLAVLAADSIGSVLESYLAHRSHSTDLTYLAPQDDDKATYAPKLTKEDGLVELATVTPDRLDRMVRALNPWPGVVSNEFGIPLKILEGYLDEISPNPSFPKEGDTGASSFGKRRIEEDFASGTRYTITKLQWAGKQPVDGETFARANRAVLTKLPPLITLGATRTKLL